MRSACTSLQPQGDNKSKELCISLTRRAACMNMTFCTSALCPAKFPHHGTNSPLAPALLPDLLLIAAGLLWARARQEQISRGASEGAVAPSSRSTAAFDYLTGRQEKTEPDSSGTCSVTAGEAMGTNCNVRNSDKVWGNIFSPSG